MIELPATERGERSREAILAAALPVFTEHGYDGASLNDIIRASGLTKGGFYFHFASKRALALAVVRDQQQRWQAEVQEAVERETAPLDRLFAQPRALARLAAEHRGPLAHSRLVDELCRDPSLRDELIAPLRGAVVRTADDIRALQATGEMRADLDSARLAEVLVGSLIGMEALTESLDDGDIVRRTESLIWFARLAILTDRT